MKISEVPLGSIIRFGSYAVRDEKPHVINWYKVRSDNTLMSKEHEDYLSFDATEPDNHNGNNDYELSNIDQFLNKAEENWYVSTHETDAPPNESNCRRGSYYTDHPGFLGFFKDWEVSLIEDSLIKYRKPITTQMAIIKRKVFLPSLSNYNSEFDDAFGGEEDARFEWVPPGAGVTAECKEHTTTGLISMDGMLRSMLRTTYPSSNSQVCAFSREMGRQIRQAYNESAIRPMLKLQNDAEVEEVLVEGEQIYVVIQTSTEIPTQEELSELLSR